MPFKTETRRFALSELRAAGKTIVGKIPYNSVGNAPYKEKLLPGCFAKVLSSGDKIISLWNHNSEKPLGNTHAGTLVLTDTPTELNVKIKPDPAISWSHDAIEAVKRGDVNGLSFGFSMARNGRGERIGKGGVREIYEVEKLWEVSPATFPAYPESSVSVRNKSNYKGNKKMEYTKENFQKILKAMETADGAELSRLGSEYDEVASVVNENAPLVRDSGVKGVLRWARLTSGEERTPLGDSQRSEKRIFESFGHHLLSIKEAGSPGGKTDPKLFDVRAATGLGEAIPSDGGFLVESQTASTLMENVFKDSPILKMATRFNLTGNATSLVVNGVDETSRATGSRAGGIRAYWLAEAAEKTASKPKFRRITLEPNKLIGLCYVTDELLSDASALDGFLTRAFQREFNWMITDAIVNGSGAGQPLGIINAGCCISITKETGQSAATIVMENINKMWQRLLISDPDSVVWLINRDALGALNSMSLAVGTGGVPVYMPAGGVSAAPYSTLFGRPVVPCESCATLGTTGDLILADMSGYYLAQKGTMKKDVSIHIRYIYDESCYRFVLRIDGQPMLGSAITPANSTETISSFVKLDTRS